MVTWKWTCWILNWWFWFQLIMTLWLCSCFFSTPLLCVEDCPRLLPCVFSNSTYGGYVLMVVCCSFVHCPRSLLFWSFDGVVWTWLTIYFDKFECASGFIWSFILVKGLVLLYSNSFCLCCIVVLWFASLQGGRLLSWWHRYSGFREFGHWGSLCTNFWMLLPITVTVNFLLWAPFAGS